MMKSSISILSILVIVGMVATTTSAIMSVQSAIAIMIGPCNGCAKDFAPGQLAKDSGLPAKDFAPGQLKNAIPVPLCIPCKGASDFAPGHIKKQPSTTTFG